MALIKCPECGKEISDKASSCPNCAYPISSLQLKDEPVKLRDTANNTNIEMASSPEWKMESTLGQREENVIAGKKTITQKSRNLKYIFAISVAALVICSIIIVFGVSKNSSNNVVNSEIIGTFVGKADLYTRTINFRADGTFYEEHQSILGLIQDAGSYVVKKDVIVLTDKNGNVHEWTFSYNKDNGNLVLYYLDVAYVKTK